MTISVMEMQPWNAFIPISVTPLPMETSPSAKQQKNAESFILRTLSGITTLNRFSQYANAKSQISVTPSGIVNASSFLPVAYRMSDFSSFV